MKSRGPAKEPPGLPASPPHLTLACPCSSLLSGFSFSHGDHSHAGHGTQPLMGLALCHCSNPISLPPGPPFCPLGLLWASGLEAPTPPSSPAPPGTPILLAPSVAVAACGSPGLGPGPCAP